MNLIFAGSGAFGIPTLRWMHANHHVVAVYTQPSKPAGRGLKLTATPVAREAASLGLPVIETADISSETLPAGDAVVVIALGQKVSPAVATHGTFGAVNLHASLLPRWRGAAPIHHAIWAGDPVTGNTIIRLAERMDAGVMLGHSTRPIEPTDTTGRLHDLLASDGPALLSEVLASFAAGTSTPVVQDESKVTVARKISRQSTLIDFATTADEVSRHIRAMSPSPGCRFRSGDGSNMTLHVVKATEGIGSPGVIGTDGRIGTGRGLLEVLELQPEGGRAMPLATYRNGRPWAAGDSLISVS